MILSLESIKNNDERSKQLKRKQSFVRLSFSQNNIDKVRQLIKQRMGQVAGLSLRRGLIKA